MQGSSDARKSALGVLLTPDGKIKPQHDAGLRKCASVNRALLQTPKRKRQNGQYESCLRQLKVKLLPFAFKLAHELLLDCKSVLA